MMIFNSTSMMANDRLGENRLGIASLVSFVEK